MIGTYNIVHEGNQAGSLKVYNEGLMTIFYAETMPLSGVRRLAVRSGENIVPIGVMTPFGRGLHLRKSFTKNMLTELGIAGIDEAFILAQNAEGEPVWSVAPDPSAFFSDPDLRAACRGTKGALYMKRGEVTELAFPIRTDAPFMLMPAFCLGVPKKIYNENYLTFTIKNGNISE